MRFLKWLAAAVVLAAGGAMAQVQQSGNVTAGHPPVFIYNNVIGDGGPANNGTLTGVGVTANNLVGMCQNTHAYNIPTTTPFVELCTGVTDAAAQITLQGYGEITPGYINLCIAGVCTPLPQGGGGGAILNSRQITSGNTDTANSGDGAIQWASASTGFKTENLYSCGPTVKGFSVLVNDEESTAGLYPIVFVAPNGNTILNGGSNGQSAVLSVMGGGARLVCDGGTTWNYFPTFPSSVFHWINASSFGVLGDENDSTTCTTSGATLTCSAKTFTALDVGKTVCIDFAGVSFHAFCGTFTSFISSTQMGMSGTPTSPLPLIHVSNMGQPVAIGSGYLVGDSLCLSSFGTAVSNSTACGTVNYIQTIVCNNSGGPMCTSANASVVAGGSGGTANQACTLYGTTGYAMQGEVVAVGVTLDNSGTMTAGTITSVSDATYALNMTNHTAEPMLASGCGSLTGVTMSFPFGVANASMNTSVGFYSTGGCSTNTYNTTTNGSGTGATMGCNSFAVDTRWGTDNTAAFQAFFTALSAQGTAINPYCGYVPAGKFFFKPPNTTIGTFACVKGDGQFDTTFFAIPNTAGDMVSTLNVNPGNSGQSQGGTLAFSDDAGPAGGGSNISDFTCIGMRSSSAIQNCVEFYGSTRWMTMERVQSYYMRGRAVGVGANLTGSGVLWESALWNNRFENNGDKTGIPTMDIGSVSGVGPNGDSFLRNRIFDSWGPAFALYSCGTGNQTHLNTINDSHLEGSGMQGTDAVGDLLQLGRVGCSTWAFPQVGGTTVTGVQDTGIGNIQGANLTLNNGIGGKPTTTTCNSNTVTQAPWAAIHVYGYCNSSVDFLSPNGNQSIVLNGLIVGTGKTFNGGVFLDAGSNNTFRISRNGSGDYDYRAQSISGASLGSGNMFDCLSANCALAQLLETSQQPTGASPTSYPVYTSSPGQPAQPVWVGTQAITNNSGSSTGMFGTGNGTTRLGMNVVNIGSRFAFTASGIVSTAASSPGTLTISILLAGTSIGSVTISPTVNMANVGYNLNLTCTFFSIGGSGTVVCGGNVMLGNTAGGAQLSTFTFGNTTNPVTVDTTSGLVFSYKTLWNSFNSGDSITNQQTLIQRQS